MKVTLDNEEIADIIEWAREDTGCYLAAVEAEKAAEQIWNAPGSYTYAILNAIIEHLRDEEQD